MSKFKVGDRVRIVGADAPWAHWNGVESIIVSDAIFDQALGLWKYRLNEANEVYAVENCLRPIYDGHEPVSWSSCVWQPKEIRVC